MSDENFLKAYKGKLPLNKWKSGRDPVEGLNYEENNTGSRWVN